MVLGYRRVGDIIGVDITKFRVYSMEATLVSPIIRMLCMWMDGRIDEDQKSSMTIIGAFGQLAVSWAMYSCSVNRSDEHDIHPSI